jgi:Ca2+-binding EF-hand superfamily protein
MLVLVRYLTLFILTLLTFAPYSFAQSSKDQEIAARFAKCDVNHDGRLTPEEAKGCMPRVYEHFSYIDSAGKGYVTVAEIQALANN